MSYFTAHLPVLRLSTAVLSALLIQSMPIHSAPGEQLLNDGRRGVACSFYSSAGRLAWRKDGGDWVDATGQLHGDKPFTTATPGGDAIKNGFRFDVSSLARSWLDGSRANTGIFLRATSDSGDLRFDSRETESGEPPVLELTWRDGRVTRHEAKMDSTLDCSTYRPIGGSQSLSVASARNTMVVFDLPEASATELDEASVVLGLNRVYGRRFAVEVYSAHPPWVAPSVAKMDGIAARYPRDGGIEDDSDVLYFMGFNDENWRTAWRSMGGGSTELLEADDERHFETLEGTALRATLKEGENTALNLQYRFAKNHGEEPEAIYFRYYLRFGDDWSPDVDGGKLPGIAGTYGKAGWGGRKADGTNGWSVRGAFSTQIKTEGDKPALTPIGSYAYLFDSDGTFGNSWGWGQGPGGLLRNNRWYAIEQYVQLNTPGINDGIFRAWIDGHLVYEQVGLNFRTIDDLRIESIWLNIYHGGTRPSPRDMSVYIDNLVIAQEYIGPLAKE